VRLLYTDIARDGALVGPNLEAYRAFAARSMRTIAFGRRLRPDDIAALADRRGGRRGGGRSTPRARAGGGAGSRKAGAGVTAASGERTGVSVAASSGLLP
jgi:hypothetical protein